MTLLCKQDKGVVAEKSCNSEEVPNLATCFFQVGTQAESIARAINPTLKMFKDMKLLSFFLAGYRMLKMFHILQPR